VKGLRSRVGRLLIVATILSVVFLPNPASAVGQYYVYNWVPAPGYPPECAESKLFYTQSGNQVNTFAQNFATVSWGGNCNLANGRPAGWLTVDLSVYVGSFICGSYRAASNPDGGSGIGVEQGCVGPTSARSSHWYYLSTAGYYTYVVETLP
jgi:hypothetical protein